MSPNGQWRADCYQQCHHAALLVSTAASHMHEQQERGFHLEPQTLAPPKPLDRITVVALHFTESLLFVADSMNRVFVVALSETISIVSTLALPNTTELPISSLRTSRNGNFLVVMTKSSLNGVHVFKRDNGTYGLYWSVPDLAGACPAAIAVINETKLAIATVSFHVYVFDLEERKLTPWSEANKFPIERWPIEISNRKDFPVRLFTNPKNESQLIMVGPIQVHCTLTARTLFPAFAFHGLLLACHPCKTNSLALLSPVPMPGHRQMRAV